LKLRLLTMLVSTATLLSGCIIGGGGHLFPVQGPAAAQNPPAVYSLSVSGQFNTGTLTATLENNESCSGTWVQPKDTDRSAGQMSAQWDQVYGAGYFVAHVLGTGSVVHATLTCKQGTTLEAEFFRTNPGSFGGSQGVAQDSKGNLYKVTF
jgi:hypothetical protein